MPRKRADLSGQKIGEKEIIRFAGKDKHGHAKWEIRCRCGRISECLVQNLKRTKGCPFCSHKNPRPYRRKRPYETIYNSLVQRARHPVLITYQQFVSFTGMRECHYCGDELRWGPEYRKKGSTSASNLDRKDNDRPYEFDNIVVACRRCNYSKNTHFTYEEWLEIGKLIRSWRI